MTGIGPVGVRCPRVRDRVREGARRIRFSSAILPPAAIRARRIQRRNGAPAPIVARAPRGDTSREHAIGMRRLVRRGTDTARRGAGPGAHQRGDGSIAHSARVSYDYGDSKADSS
jgi:hypothetical protein